MDYDSGGYRILVSAEQANFWSTPRKDLADVRLEVDEGKLGGPDENRVGLICRYSGNNFYFFIITHDGYYGIGMFSGDQETGGRMDLIGQTEMIASPQINTGTNVNHLRADPVRQWRASGPGAGYPPDTWRYRIARGVVLRAGCGHHLR
jgi:hypothetical protein